MWEQGLEGSDGWWFHGGGGDIGGFSKNGVAKKSDLVTSCSSRVLWFRYLCHVNVRVPARIYDFRVITEQMSSNCCVCVLCACVELC